MANECDLWFEWNFWNWTCSNADKSDSIGMHVEECGTHKMRISMVDCHLSVPFITCRVVHYSGVFARQTLTHTRARRICRVCMTRNENRPKITFQHKYTLHHAHTTIRFFFLHFRMIFYDFLAFRVTLHVRYFFFLLLWYRTNKLYYVIGTSSMLSNFYDNIITTEREYLLIFCS